MAYTNVETLDDALAALNGARQPFRPDFCLISSHADGRGISVRWNGGYATREINSATTVVWRAKERRWCEAVTATARQDAQSWP